MALSSTTPFPNFLCLSLPFSLQHLLIFFFFLCSPLRVTYLCSLLKNHYRDMVLGSCYGAATVKFFLDFKIFSILCWNLCVNCWTNIVGSFSFSVVLICWTTLSLLLYCFFFLTISLENRPKSTETDWNQNIIEINGFNHFGRFRLRISQTEIFSFSWPYTYKTDWTEQSTPLPRGKPSWAIYSDGAFVILRLFVEMRREFLEE